MKKYNLNFAVLESFDREILILKENKSVNDLLDKSNRIERLIDELIEFKRTLRRGPDRLKNRKESSNLQRAIETLRFLNKKNSKLIDELSKEDFNEQ